MKKNILFVLVILILPFMLFSQQEKYISSTVVKKIFQQAEEKSDVEEVIRFLDSTITKTVNQNDKQCLQVFLAHLYEDTGMYAEAQKLYVQASVLEVASPLFSKEELLLYAARCALSCGETESAESVIRIVLKTAKDKDVVAMAKLYIQWAQFCKIETVEELYEPKVVLDSYLKIDSMKSIHPLILFTLWYVTGDVSYSDELKTKWPKSTEYSMVLGKTDVLPGPFWYFLPRESIVLSVDTSKKQEQVNEKKEIVKAQDGVLYLQLGFFQSMENAQHLSDRLKKSGFNPVITEEKRESGNTYYVVIVYEDSDHSIAEKLRNSGYECYPVFAE